MSVDAPTHEVRACRAKMYFGSEQAAAQKAKNLTKKTGETFYVYKCKYRRKDHWHLSTQRGAL